MNTDKIYAESIAKEYAPKDSSKIVALRKLDRKAKMPATISPTPSALFHRSYWAQECVLQCKFSVAVLSVW